MNVVCIYSELRNQRYKKINKILVLNYLLFLIYLLPYYFIRYCENNKNFSNHGKKCPSLYTLCYWQHLQKFYFNHPPPLKKSENISYRLLNDL